MPRIHIRPSQVGPKLAIASSLFVEISLSNIVRKSQPPIMTPEPRPQANSYLIWFSSYHLSPKKMLATDFVLRIFWFHCFSRALTSKNWPNPLFQIKPSQALSKEILFQTGTPCQGSFNFLYHGVPDLSRAAAEEFSKPVQPPSTKACRDEISRSGEPLTPMRIGRIDNDPSTRPQTIFRQV